MRLANLAGRAALVVSEFTAVDVATASNGKFGPALPELFERWDEFLPWAQNAPLDEGRTAFERSALGPPSPTPRQVFGVGMNYRDHAAEAGVSDTDEEPPIFTKFVSCITGPDSTVTLPTDGQCDWEVELVVVMGMAAWRIPEGHGWDHVAGICIGQDISERTAQFAGPMPQFNMAKSAPGFGPTGPWLVSSDEFDDRDDLAIGCSLNEVIMQNGRTSAMLWSVGRLVASISARVPLLPGDLIFTGTPAGVGMGRDPQRFISHGEVLDSWIEGVGSIRQVFSDQ